MRYTPFHVYVGPSQEKSSRERSRKKVEHLSLFPLMNREMRPYYSQKIKLKKIERAGVMGKKISIKMSAAQVKANTKHNGGFLWSLEARLAPAILSGVGSALASKVTSSLLNKKGQGLYLQKMGIVLKFNL